MMECDVICEEDAPLQESYGCRGAKICCHLLKLERNGIVCKVCLLYKSGVKALKASPGEQDEIANYKSNIFL